MTTTKHTSNDSIQEETAETGMKEFSSSSSVPWLHILTARPENILERQTEEYTVVPLLLRGYLPHRVCIISFLCRLWCQHALSWWSHTPILWCWLYTQGLSVWNQVYFKRLHVSQAHGLRLKLLLIHSSELWSSASSCYNVACVSLLASETIPDTSHVEPW